MNHTWGNRTSDNPYGQGALRTMIEQLPFLPLMLDGHYAQNNEIKTSPILIDKMTRTPVLRASLPKASATPSSYSSV